MTTAGLQFTWTGFDASVWNLSDYEGWHLLEGVRGLGMPPVDHHRSQSPVVAGSRYRGTRVLQRDVFWPIAIRHDGTPTQFATRDRAFWETMRPTRFGTWKVTQPNGDFRTIDLRFESVDDSWEMDPLLFGRNVYGISLVAERPFWAGPAVVLTFGSSGSQSMVNPGDVPGWTVWTLDGPISSGAVVGQVDATITVPVDVPSGQTLTITTAQDAMNAFFDDGTEVILPDSSRFPYTPNERTHVATFSGAGTIVASLTPSYYRAY